MKILFVDHTSLISGAQRALLELLPELDGRADVRLLAPPGPLAEATRALGVPVTHFAGTSGSFKLHPIHTPKALAEIALGARAVAREAERSGASLVHANSLRAGLMAAFARSLGGPPVVCHVHDALAETRSADVVRWALRPPRTMPIAVSRYSADRFDRHQQPSPMPVVYNPLDLVRFDPKVETAEEAKRALGSRPDELLVGIVAQITPWKGQDDAIRAFAIARQRVPDARLLIVGEPKFVSSSTRFDNLSYLESLHRLVRELDLESSVEFWGDRDDVPRIFRALDIALTPSWEEPLGRSVLEAMAMETAVIATSLGGPAEVITDRVEGLLRPPRDSEAWGRALTELLEDGDLRRAMALRASRAVAERFESRAFAEEMMAIYALAASGTAPAS